MVTHLKQLSVVSGHTEFCQATPAFVRRRLRRLTHQSINQCVISKAHAEIYKTMDFLQISGLDLSAYWNNSLILKCTLMFFESFFFFSRAFSCMRRHKGRSQAEQWRSSDIVEKSTCGGSCRRLGLTHSTSRVQGSIA